MRANQIIAILTYQTNGKMNEPFVGLKLLFFQTEHVFHNNARRVEKKNSRTQNNARTLFFPEKEFHFILIMKELFFHIFVSEKL